MNEISLHQLDFHIELIKCPECEYKQWAKVEHTFPFYSYVHWCDNCNYCIMESEWNKVNEIERDQEIEKLKNSIEDAEITIKEAKERLKELGVKEESNPDWCQHSDTCINKVCIGHPRDCEEDKR